MPRNDLILAAICLTFGIGDAMAALDVFVYPSQGQTEEQQEQDEYACYKWAHEETGFDPTQTTVQQAGPAPTEGGLMRGAARGAVLGAIGGAIAGDAGTGAAIGAGVGTATGAIRRRDATAEAAAANQQAVQQYEASLHGYKRAFAACMTGRGYTVN